MEAMYESLIGHLSRATSAVHVFFGEELTSLSRLMEMVFGKFFFKILISPFLIFLIMFFYPSPLEEQHVTSFHLYCCYITCYFIVYTLGVEFKTGFVEIPTKPSGSYALAGSNCN